MPLPVEDTPSAASTCLVDAVNYSLTYEMFSGLTQTLPVFTRADVLFSLGTVIVSSRSWQGLMARKKSLTDALMVMEFRANCRKLMLSRKRWRAGYSIQVSNAYAALSRGRSVSA